MDTKREPKPRKLTLLNQAYKTWRALSKMRQEHNHRLKMIRNGTSKMDPVYEELWLQVIEPLEERARKEMSSFGHTAGPVWYWMTAIRGIGDHTAAKILSLIDDPGKFETVSKLWRFSGYGLKDGKIDRRSKGVHSPYSNTLRAELHEMMKGLVMSKSPLYGAIYYEEKDRQKEAHPDPICKSCGGIAEQKSKSWYCTQCGATGRSLDYTPAHLDSRAYRKTIKIFLQHLWVIWREAEGLPVSKPYAHGILGHTNYVAPERPDIAEQD